MPPPAPWLQAPDVAGDYLKGVSIGASIAEARQRINAEQTRTYMEAQARQVTNERETQLEQARLQTETAYKNEQLGLRKQQLEQAAKINAARTRDAALKMADQHGFASDLASGMPIEQALYRHPRLSTPSAAVAAHKAGLDNSAEKLDLQRQRLDIAHQQLKDREGRTQRPIRIGETVSTDEDTGAKTTKYLFDRPMDAPPARSATPFKEGQKVRNKKDGKTYVVKNGVPVEQQEEP